MKALVCEAYGPIANLVGQGYSRSPVPGPKQVLIEVQAAAVNFPDALMVQGLYQVKPPLPFTPGAEIAGVVKAVGAEAPHYKAGRPRHRADQHRRLRRGVPGRRAARDAAAGRPWISIPARRWC
jgi:NADPH:quinone reductase-like Zn-dependent oxidoreductase